MGLSIATNVSAMTTSRHLSTAGAQTTRSLDRLSSGFRINRAADDAAGLAISEGLRSQVGGMTQALRNTQDAVNVLQTADGALAQTTSILQRMRDLAVQAANFGAVNGTGAKAVQAEMQALKSELTSIADSTSFNGIRLLDGSYRHTFQVGAEAGHTVLVTIGQDMDAAGLGVAGIDVGSGLDPRSVGSYAAQSSVDRIQLGSLVFVGATSTGSIPTSGTISYDGHTLDLGQVTYTDTNGDGVVSRRERVAQLNTAATAAGITHRTDPFVDDGDDLIFRGVTPAAGRHARLPRPHHRAAPGGARHDRRERLHVRAGLGHVHRHRRRRRGQQQRGAGAAQRGRQGVRRHRRRRRVRGDPAGQPQ